MHGIWFLSALHGQPHASTFFNFDPCTPQSDFISFRHHTYEQPRGPKSTELKECGPRFELKLYQIKLGTMDQAHAENEYVLRSYINSAKRSKLAEAEGTVGAVGV